MQQVTWGAPAQSEVYGYDENGRRIAKAQVSGGTVPLTFYPFDFYEQRGSSSSGVTKYYFFAGERFAMRTGTGVANGLRLLYKDRISSTVHVTDQNGSTQGSTGYTAFGATMRITGTIPTDHRFTDQQLDGTGLYYYGSRYYDPQLGQFILPDTVVPDPTNVMDYNRYAYARGNPLKYNDPSGHRPVCILIIGLTFAMRSSSADLSNADLGVVEQYAPEIKSAAYDLHVDAVMLGMIIDHESGNIDRFGGVGDSAYMRLCNVVSVNSVACTWCQAGS